MYRHIAGGLLMSCIAGLSYADMCPDMTNYSGILPAGWHARVDQVEKTSGKQQLERALYSVSAKNGLRCGYQTESGNKFTLSMQVALGLIFKPVGSHWKYDEIEEIWECTYDAKHTLMSIDQCAFTFDKTT